MNIGTVELNTQKMIAQSDRIFLTVVIRGVRQAYRRGEIASAHSRMVSNLRVVNRLNDSKVKSAYFRAMNKLAREKNEPPKSNAIELGLIAAIVCLAIIGVLV